MEKQAKKKKSIFKRWWFWLIVIIVIIIGAANAGGNDTPKKVGTNQPASSSSESKEDKVETNAPKIFKIGDVIQLKDFKVTVNGIRTATQDKDGIIKAESGNEFLLVDCTIENISKENQSVSSMLMFKVVDKDGRNYQQEIFTDAKGQLDGDIAPTRKITGEYVVQVPKDKKGLELEFDSSLFLGGQVIVELR